MIQVLTDGSIVGFVTGGAGLGIAWAFGRKLGSIETSIKDLKDSMDNLPCKSSNCIITVAQKEK